jgi:hypothetical protein
MKNKKLSNLLSNVFVKNYHIFKRVLNKPTFWSNLPCLAPIFASSKEIKPQP